MTQHIHDHSKELSPFEGGLPSEEYLGSLGELFKVFGERTRIRILYALSQSELCVFAISQLLDMEQSAVSHQLKVLRQNRLVKYKKVGKNVFYELSDDHVRDIIEKALEHIGE